MMLIYIMFHVDLFILKSVAGMHLQYGKKLCIFHTDPSLVYLRDK